MVFSIVGKKEKIWTTADTVEEFLNNEQITVGEHDELHVSPETEIKNDLEITLNRAFPIVMND